MRSVTPPEDRFRRYLRPADNGCIEWTGGRLPKGYGMFWSGTARVYAHRWAYEAEHGPIPDGLHIDHLCRNRRCVNVAHLEAVTSGENTRRGRAAESAKERAANRTHCPSGHEYSGENVVIRRNGKRYCRECRLAASRAWHKAHPDKGRMYAARYREKKRREADHGYL